MYVNCKNCGKMLPDTAKFCPGCGRTLDSSNVRSSGGLQQPKPLAPLKKAEPPRSSVYEPTRQYSNASEPERYSPPPAAPSRVYVSPPEDTGYTRSSYSPPKSASSPKPPEYNYYDTTMDNRPTGYGAPAGSSPPPSGYGSRDPYSPPPGYGAPSSPYSPPPGYGAPTSPYSPPPGYGTRPVVNNYMYGSPSGGRRYMNVSEVPPTPMFWISLLFTLLAFIGIFTPWATAKGKVAGYKVTSKNTSYTDFYKSDKGSLYSETLSELTSKYDSKLHKIDICIKIMKWGGLAGFLLLVIDLLFAAAFRNYMSGINALACVCFIAALIAAFVDCSLSKSITKDLLGFTSGTVDISIYPSLGIYIPLGCTLIASICASVDVRERRHLLGMNR